MSKPMVNFAGLVGHFDECSVGFHGLSERQKRYNRACAGAVWLTLGMPTAAELDACTFLSADLDIQALIGEVAAIMDWADPVSGSEIRALIDGTR